MKYISILLVSTLLLACAKSSFDFIVEDITASDFQIHKIAPLSNILKESSGLEISTINEGDTLLWSHNDHKGAAQLYGFDTQGVLSKTLTIDNANNEDWEDLAQDNDGNLYIGDGSGLNPLI